MSDSHPKSQKLYECAECGAARERREVVCWMCDSYACDGREFVPETTVDHSLAIGAGLGLASFVMVAAALSSPLLAVILAVPFGLIATGLVKLKRQRPLDESQFNQRFFGLLVLSFMALALSLTIALAVTCGIAL